MTKHVRVARLTAFSDPELAYRAGQWFKSALLGDVKAEAWCARNGLPLVEQRALGESIGTASGFLVPDELSSAIIAQREVYGALRATAQIAPMASDTLTFPRRTSAVTASFVGESIAITEQSGITFDNLTLTAKKLTILVRASSELAEDAVVDLGQFLTDEFAYAFALKEDQVGFNGDGTSTYGGIRGVTTLLTDAGHTAGKVTTATHDLFSEIDVSDLGKMIGTVPSNALPGARWFVSQYAFGAVLCRLAAAAGGIVVMPDANGRLVPHFMGFPVQITQVLPQIATAQNGAVMFLFGDMSLACTAHHQSEVEFE